MESIVHKPALATHFHEIRVPHDFQMVRDRHDFRFQKFRNVADRQFSMTQCIHNLQPMRVTQRPETLGTKRRIKNFLGHNDPPLYDIF